TTVESGMKHRIEFSCVGCGRHHSVQSAVAGRLVRCECGQQISVPATSARRHDVPSPVRQGPQKDARQKRSRGLFAQTVYVAASAVAGALATAVCAYVFHPSSPEPSPQVVYLTPREPAFDVPNAPSVLLEVRPVSESTYVVADGPRTYWVGPRA